MKIEKKTHNNFMKKSFFLNDEIKLELKISYNIILNLRYLRYSGWSICLKYDNIIKWPPIILSLIKANNLVHLIWNCKYFDFQVYDLMICKSLQT